MSLCLENEGALGYVLLLRTMTLYLGTDLGITASS